MARRKKSKQQRNSIPDANGSVIEDEKPLKGKKAPEEHKIENGVQVEYVPEEFGGGYGGFEAFREVFDNFKRLATGERQSKKKSEQGAEEEEDEDLNKKKKGKDAPDRAQDEEEENGSNNKKKLTRKEKKLQSGTRLVEMKQKCKNPSVVEVWDANAPDPELLIYLKAYRNTVPVPRHWSEKGRYLSRKLGKEKSSYQLPDYIAATGIGKVREAHREKEESKSLKQKQSAKMRGKVGLGKMSVDYQVLHEAFFKYQTKPKLTGFGEMYYAGKEEEDMSEKRKSFKPGVLSHELRTALGIGPNDFVPWVYNLQRFGPPPCYPGLQIPGARIDLQPIYVNENLSLDRSRWGDLNEVEEEEEEEEEQEEEEQEEQGNEEAAQLEEQSYEPSEGGSSVVATPTEIELRKKRLGEQQQQQIPQQPQQLYQVVEKQDLPVAPNTLLSTTHKYVVPGTSQSKVVDLMKSKNNGNVDVALNPEELERGLDEKHISEKYEEARRSNAPETEDFSDMVAERERSRKRKDRDKQAKNKKDKQFKF